MDKDKIKGALLSPQGVIIEAAILIIAVVLASVVIIKQMRDEYALKEASINARLAQISSASGELEGRMQELLSQVDKEYSEKQQLIGESVDQERLIRELRESYDEKLRLISELYQEEMLKMQLEKEDMLKTLEAVKAEAAEAKKKNTAVVSNSFGGGGDVYVDLKDLRIKSNATEAQLNKLLSGSKLEGLGGEFLLAEQDYGVNAIVLMSIMKQESGLGRSTIADYNTAGMKTGSGEWRKFESYAECIRELASLLKRQYLYEGGAYYNGTGITDVNIKYCLNLDGTTDWGWSTGITSHVKGFVAKANE